MTHILMLLAMTALVVQGSTVTNFTMVSISGQAVVKQFELREGQSLRVLQSYVEGSTPLVAFTRDNVRIYVGPLGARTEPAQAPFIYGPGTVELYLAADCCSSQVARNIISLSIDGATPPGGVPVVNIPSNAVVIPADAGGPVRVLLESSTDLITWNSAEPGTYGTSTTNRFFRVRTVRN